MFLFEVMTSFRILTFRKLDRKSQKRPWLLATFSATSTQLWLERTISCLLKVIPWFILTTHRTYWFRATGNKTILRNPPWTLIFPIFDKFTSLKHDAVLACSNIARIKCWVASSFFACLFRFRHNIQFCKIEFLANSAFITSIFDMNDVSGERMMSRTFCISDLLLSVSKSEIDSSSGSKLVFAFEMHSLEINKWWKFCHKWMAASDSVVTYSGIPSVIILEPDWY